MSRRAFAAASLIFAASLFAQQATPPAAKPASPAQTAPAASTAAASMSAAKPEDVASINSIIAALYDVISGPSGQARDWDRFRSLFVPEGRLVPNGIRPDGTVNHSVLSVDDYVNRASGSFAKQGFFESETARSEQHYDKIAHIFSTYESRHEKAGEPFAKGINSIQLLNDGKRWYIVTIMWEGESPSAPIPAEYQKK